MLWYSFPEHPTGRRLLSNLSVQSKNNWSGGRTFDSTSWGCICSVFVVLGIEPMVSNMLGKSSVTVSSLFHSSSFPSSFLIKARFLVKLAMLAFNSLSILCMCWILNLILPSIWDHMHELWVWVKESLQGWVSGLGKVRRLPRGRRKTMFLLFFFFSRILHHLPPPFSRFMTSYNEHGLNLPINTESEGDMSGSKHLIEARRSGVQDHSLLHEKNAQ